MSNFKKKFKKICTNLDISLHYWHSKDGGMASCYVKWEVTEQVEQQLHSWASSVGAGSHFLLAVMF